MSDIFDWHEEPEAIPSVPPEPPPAASLFIKYYPDLIQGSDEWLAVRCGLLTASEMKLILTPTLQLASNEKERAHLYELLAQRVTRYVEPRYIGDDMLRGQEDEIEARALYHKHIAPVQPMGFVTNNQWGFTIGYSPDGLIGDDGLLECKSRRQKFQVQTWIECVPSGEAPPEYLCQMQTGMLVTGRAWCDLASYSGGMPMAIIRVHRDDKAQAAIIEAAAAFEARLARKHGMYEMAIRTAGPLIETVRRERDVEIVL